MLLRVLLWAVLVVIALVAAVVTVGWMLPKEHVASAETTVGVPREKVFATILDVRRYPEWRKDVKQVHVLADTPLRWEEHGSNGVIRYEVREQHAPDRVVTAIADPGLPFGGTWTYELAGTGASTHVSITEHGEVRNPVFRFISRVFLSRRRRWSSIWRRSTGGFAERARPVGSIPGYAANAAYAGSAGRRTGSSSDFSQPLGQAQFTQTGSPQGEQRLSVSFQHTTHSASPSSLDILKSAIRTLRGGLPHMCQSSHRAVTERVTASQTRDKILT